jgi:hypothetical protein
MPCLCCYYCSTGPLQSEIDLALVNEHLPEYGDSFKQLTVQVMPETPTRLHVKISPAGQQRWEVPEKVVPRCVEPSNYNHAVVGPSNPAMQCGPLRLAVL